MSKAKSGSEKNDNSSKRWASTVSISDNVARQGVELYFDKEPHPELQSKMRVVGFMPSKSTTMWYAKDAPTIREFADNVKTVLPMLATGPDLFIQPSYEPGKANIENKRFSFVHISLKDGQEKSFIVFEPSKPRAEVLAANFAYKHYGSNYFALAVNPKSNMREARMLFAEGKIIGETKSEEVSYETNETKADNPEEESSPTKETTQVTFGGEKANLSLILHEFHKWLKDHPEHKGSTKIRRPVFDEWLKQHHPEVSARETETLWDRHQRLVKIMNRIGNLDTKQIVIEPYSSIYNKLLTIIPSLMELLESGESFSSKSEVEGYQDLHFDYLRKDKQGYVIALAHYYELNGDLVSDPDMEIRIIPEMKMAEAMTFQNTYTYDEVYIRDESGKELVDTNMKRKLNSYLKEWLTTLISYGHKVKLVTEDEKHSEHVEEASPEKEPESAEAQIFDVNLENVQHIVGVEEHESEYGESRKIPESTHRTKEEEKNKESISRHKEENEDPELGKKAYELLTKIIPELETYIKGEKTQGTLKYQLWSENKELTCFLNPEYQTLFLVEEVNGEKHLESDIRIDVEAKEAYVTSEWLSDYYSEGLGRTEGNIEYEGDDMALGRDMTRGLIQWMGDLTDEGLTVKLSPQDAEDENPLEFLGEPETDEGVSGKIAFNPTVLAKLINENQELSDKWKGCYSEDPILFRNRFSKIETRKLKDFYNTYILDDETKEKEYNEILKSITDVSFIISDQAATPQPAPELKRFFSPEQEKEILKTFSDFGYTSPFTVKEAFDRKLPVLDICQRSQSVEVYFHDHYGEPLKVQIRKLEVKAKKGKFKPRSKEDTAIKGQLFELGLKLSRAEKAYQDEFLLFQDDFVAYVLEKAKAAGYQPENEQELIDFQVFVVESVFDGRTVEYYPREPIGKLVAELISDFFDADKKAAAAEAQKNAGVRVVDIIRYGALVPNVMIPAQTKEPFISAYFTDYNLKEVIKKSFPYLRKLTNKTLLKASPLEMFELVQMSHPTDYGIKVDRSDMLREWERRGKKLFIGLGFPIDPEYPYVNVNTGYDSVEPLNQLLFDHNKEGNQWWAVADNWRPVADLQKALVFIDSQIETVKDRMKETINPKTKKPQGSFKDEHRQLQFNLRDFEESRQFIADYLAKHKAQHPLLQEPEKNDEDAGQVMPVYINEAIAVPDIRIKDPADQSSRKRTISKKAYDILSAKLTKANSDVLFYQGGAFTLLKSGEELLLIEQPELEATATNYFDNIFRKSKECKDREKERKKDFVKELKEAEWQETHGRDPIDKITMNGVVYHRVRLLERVLEEFRYLYVSDQIDLVNQLHEVFNQRPKLEYQDAFGKADPGIRPVAASYVKNTILDNDFITSDKNYPALKYVLAALQAVPVTKKTSELKAKPAAKAVVESRKEQTEQGLAKTGLAELKAAFWGPEDGKYPSDKILINGQAFSQVRLRHEFERLLGNLPLPEQHTIIDTLGKKYPLAYDVEDYAKGLVTIGKTGAKREKVVLAGYMDNIIRQHDFPIKGKRDYSVCRLLIELLLNPKNETGKDISENPAVTVEGKRVVIIPFPKSSQFEGEVKVLDDNGVFIVGAQYNKRFGSQSYEKTNPGDNGKKYSNLNAAITDGIAWIKDRLLFEMQHKDGMYNSEAKKNVKVKAALEALEIFAKEYEPGKENLVDVPMKEKPALRKINKTDQHQLNKQIEALIDEKDSKGASFSDEEKNLIRQYTGSGGLLKQGATGRGVLYEYYTPDWLVEQMWQLARMYGYNGGSVLEPSVGTGNFLKHAPETAIVFGFETNHYSARISQVLYPHAHIHEKAFESLFFAGNIHLKDKIDHPLFSLVIGNPPYGEFTGKYAGMGEKKWTGALEYDQYFMLRGLDLLEPGGLMVFVVPSLFIQSEHKYNKTKEKIFQKAEVLKCFRLPQGVFKTTDIGTDIIVLKKRSAAEATRTQVGGIDEESLPFGEAMKPMKCGITGLAIKKGDKIFYDLDKKVFIKALKIKGGDNPREIVLNNLWLPDTIKELFENYMAQHGDRNELREKYYGEDSIYDPDLVVDAALEYIHEAMFDEKVSSCWLHKIDITEAFGD